MSREETRAEDIAALAAAAIFPDHFVLEEDCWYSCPERGECCNDDAKGCNCGLAWRRERAARIILEAMTNRNPTEEREKP
jgi:hypothetical protein